jgi:hypothetical protein
MPRWNQSLSERFWSKVSVSGPGDCWPWRASRSRKGYGRINIDRRSHNAHRVAWLLANGAVPDDRMVCHHCDNPPCCNPAHLFLGEAADNTADMMQKGRHRTRVPDLLARGERFPQARLTNDGVAEARRLRAEGHLSIEQIAQRFGVSVATMASALRGDTWSHVGEKPAVRSRADAMRNRSDKKLSDADVRAIRSEYAAGGISQKALAKKYGVAQGLIWGVLNRQFYSHVD